MGSCHFFYLVWSGVIVAALAVAGIHLVRDRVEGIPAAMLAAMGAISSWALLPAYIGICENEDYARSLVFALSLGVGLTGLSLLVFSCSKLR